nr:MAG TPA: Glycine cleavage T-protein C-terminal barrel domain [Inoviridae sp.]
MTAKGCQVTSGRDSSGPGCAFGVAYIRNHRK